MAFNINSLFLFLAIISTGLVAGLFYGWEISVIPGIQKINAKSYLEAMQSINKEILNPWFYFIFLGSIFCLPTLTISQYNTGINTKFWLIFSALAIYFIGTIGVTTFGNVPMNNALEAIPLNTLTAEELNNTRINYETKWNQFNKIRTIASLIAFSLLTFVSIVNSTDN